jgi:hypothetical protein
MAKDYKNRVQRKAKKTPTVAVGLWKWLLITLLILGFVVFLVFLKMSSGGKALATVPALSTEKLATVTSSVNELVEHKPKPPHFEFYTLLPQKEVVVPEYEIKTRTREERVGKLKSNQYIMQAGSFKTLQEAEQLIAKVAAMGIESKLEKAKVGDVAWYRVKMGPFSQVASVNSIRTRLRKNSVDVIVTEVGEAKESVVKQNNKPIAVTSTNKEERVNGITTVPQSKPH